jgi:hypothetical protein
MPPATTNTANEAAGTEGPDIAQAAEAAKTCSSPAAIWANQPDGGVVFVNAWHRRDAGNIDRLQGVVDALGTEADKFRCCFGGWVTDGPSGDGKLLLELEIDADGQVTAAAIDSARTDVDNVITRACVISVARAVRYPESPSGVATQVEYPFVMRLGP